MNKYTGQRSISIIKYLGQLENKIEKKSYLEKLHAF